MIHSRKEFMQTARSFLHASIEKDKSSNIPFHPANKFFSTPKYNTSININTSNSSTAYLIDALANDQLSEMIIYSIAHSTVCTQKKKFGRRFNHLKCVLDQLLAIKIKKWGLWWFTRNLCGIVIIESNKTPFRLNGQLANPIYFWIESIHNKVLQKEFIYCLCLIQNNSFLVLKVTLFAFI